MPYTDHPFDAAAPLTELARKQGIATRSTLLHYLRHLPYGRNSSRGDLSLVLTEGQGTCSSKHALAKAIALENGLDEVQLVLCIYQMNAQNTPGIAVAITDTGLTYIPEAHCYLDISGQAVDITAPGSDYSRIQSDIMQEESILPEQVTAYKVAKHRSYIETWCSTRDARGYAFDEVWAIREACIAALSHP